MNEGRGCAVASRGVLEGVMVCDGGEGPAGLRYGTKGNFILEDLTSRMKWAPGGGRGEGGPNVV